MFLALTCGILIGATLGVIALIIHILAGGNDYPGLEDVSPLLHEDAMEN
jgi:hypothetical protein